MQPLHEAETSLGFILSLSSVYVVHHKSESGNEEASRYRIMEIFRNPETPSLHDLNRWSFHFLLFNKLISQVTFNFKLIQMHSRNLIIILAFNQGPWLWRVSPSTNMYVMQSTLQNNKCIGIENVYDILWHMTSCNR